MVKPWGYNEPISMPTKKTLLGAFARLGTQREVALSFDVSRATILKWQRLNQLSIQYHPEMPKRKRMKRLLTRRTHRVRVAQWLADEGTITTIYDKKNNSTYLSVAGQMTDLFALEEISKIMGTRVNNGTTVPVDGWMPMSYVRVNGAEAYVLLETIRSQLIGLKGMQAEEALKYFPKSGLMKGRHSTDEFMMPAWNRYAIGVLLRWNQRRPAPLSTETLQQLAASWIAARVKRARRYRDRNKIEN